MKNKIIGYILTAAIIILLIITGINIFDIVKTKFNPPSSDLSSTAVPTITSSPAPTPDVSSSPEPSGASESSSESYICNKRSKKFHRPTCANLPKEQNRLHASDREQIIADGYSPCGNCKP